MFGTHDIALFVAAGLLLNITPGPDLLYIAARATREGIRAGVAAALGVGAGCLVHVAAAALGLSALLAASATAFSVLKLIGAVYLVYVGISLMRAAPVAASAPPAPAALRTVFAQGFLTNALNPKVALFFLAFLPQFIDPQAASKPLAFLFLGIVFNFNGTLWNLLVAWLSARAGTHLARTRAAQWLGRVIGGFFVVLGVRLAFARPA